MTEYSGSSRPIVVTSMRGCCLASVEAYIRAKGDDPDGTVVACSEYPKNTDHRVMVKDGKWRGKVATKPTAVSKPATGKKK
jgi:hypothetical protein